MAGLEPARAFYGPTDFKSVSVFPLTILVPVAGVSVDKLIALCGDPSIVARIQHIHTGNIFEAFQRFHDDLRKEIGARVIAIEPSTAQLALPNHEAVSDSGS